jgi:hypothetical protein
MKMRKSLEKYVFGCRDTFPLTRASLACGHLNKMRRDGRGDTSPFGRFESRARKRHFLPSGRVLLAVG